MKTVLSARSRITSLLLIIFLFLPLGYPTIIWSEEYPTKPITLTIGMAPGGVTDIAMRAISDEAKKYLRQEILPVNKPGASQTVAMGSVISNPTDGYTLGGTTDAPYIRGPHLLTLTFDPFAETIPIVLFGTFHNVVFVRSDSPFKTFDDFINFAKKNPGKLTFGTAGVGTMPYLGMEGMAMSKKFKVSQVPHTGDQPVVLAVLGGHIMAGGVGIDACIPQVRAGKIRMLALIEGKERITALPELPTLYEFGFGNAFIWS
jgi:tripartite-type tricarboxylate transporter receptor subunit TctC